MNWEMLGAIGEILGAMGVIATLGYLATQVRANTRALRLDAERDAYDGSLLVQTQVSGDAELARIVRIGLNGMDALDPDEAMRFGIMMLSYATQWMRMHSFERDEEVAIELTESTRRIRRDIVATPGFQQWFELRKHWLPDELTSTLEREIAVAAGSYVPYHTDSE